MTRYEDLTGRRFGRLTALSFAGLNENRNAVWKCRCDCGREVLALAINLKGGRTRSCGCLRRELTRQRNEQRFQKIRL